jgi:hypothetical protein
MSLSRIDILRTDGALARPPASNDGISGIIYYGTNGTSGNIGLSFKINTALDSLAFCLSDSKLRYHINRYFKWSQSPLYVHVKDITSSTFDEVETLKNFSNGEIRILGILNDNSNYSSSHLSALQTKAEICEDEKAPLQIVYSSRYTGTINALTTIATTNNRVSFIIGESLSGKAKELKTKGATWVGSIGEILGVKSASKVSDSIGWVGKFDLLDGEEFTEVGFVNGESLKNISTTLQNTLDDYKYIFVRKFVGDSGAYFNYGHTAVGDTASDFTTIEFNTVYDKAFRNIYTVLLPKVNSPLKVNSAGKLDLGVIEIFKQLGKQALQNMKDEEEISDFSFDIDENQNVLSTSKLQIIAKIIPIGVAKVIEVKLGFALTLS